MARLRSDRGLLLLRAGRRTALLGAEVAMSTLVPAASGGSFLITPNVGLMIWTLVLFAISLFALWKLAFPAISAALDKRQKAIEDSIDHAEEIRKRADGILAEYK